MNQRLSTLLIALVVLSGLIYAGVRSHQNGQLADQIQQYQMQRQRAQTLLTGIDPALLRSRPVPQPDLAGWLVQNPLKTLTDRQAENKRTQDGGVALKLRNLTPQEISSLLAQMTQVGVRLVRFELADPDGDGQWTLEMVVQSVGAP